MSLRFYERGGLLLPLESSDEQAVSRALKRLDPLLFLDKQVDDEHGCFVFKVYRRTGSETPPVFICGWWDDYLRPLPLSRALVDRVASLDRNSRVPYEDPHEHNKRLRERVNQEVAERADEIVRYAGKQAEGRRSRGVTPGLSAGRRRGSLVGEVYGR